MRIVFLISSLEAGGAERVASTLSNAWAARGDSVTLVPTFSGGGTPFYGLNPQVELVYLAARAGAATAGSKRYAARLRALRTLITERRPDVVLSFMPNVNIAALAATAFTGVPCVVCERSDPRHLPMSPAWRIACKAFYRTADGVVVQTRAVADAISRLYGKLPDVAVVPNPLPVDLQRIRVGESCRKRRALLSLGRLSEEKRVGRIVDAFAALAPRFPDWDLHIHGDGPQKAEIEARVQALGLPSRVTLAGRSNDPWRVMSGADAFVMASRFEGFPNALLEAMGIGLPCVATDCESGPREITRGGTDALLVGVDDHAALRDALARLMGDAQLRQQLGQSARESVTARYALDNVLSMWDAVFRSVGVAV